MSNAAADDSKAVYWIARRAKVRCVHRSGPGNDGKKQAALTNKGNKLSTFCTLHSAAKEVNSRAAECMSTIDV
jgi:hypothetical protein